METLSKIIWFVIETIVSFMTIGFGLILVLSFILAWFFDRIPKKLLLFSTLIIGLILITFMII